MAQIQSHYDLRTLVTATLTSGIDTAIATAATSQSVTCCGIRAILRSRKECMDFPCARVTPAMYTLDEASGHTRATLDIGVLIEDHDADADELDKRCDVYMTALLSTFDKVRATDGSYYLRVTEGDPSPAEVHDGIWIQGVAVRITAHMATDRS